MASRIKTKKLNQVKDSESKSSKIAIEKHLIIRRVQKQISDEFNPNAKPSITTNIYWIYAFRQKGKYHESNVNSGKWLVFVNIKNVDAVWGKIKLATENGLLGESSKVATAKPNPNAGKSNLKVICVYTYDYTDKDDVLRIRNELRKIGIINKIPYKTDNATREGRYEVKGDTRISVYYE
jgi:hypothetical protein